MFSVNSEKVTWDPNTFAPVALSSFLCLGFILGVAYLSGLILGADNLCGLGREFSDLNCCIGFCGEDSVKKS